MHRKVLLQCGLREKNLDEKKKGPGSHTRNGVRTHVCIRTLDLKSNALTTRPPWYAVITVRTMRVNSQPGGPNLPLPKFCRFLYTNCCFVLNCVHFVDVLCKFRTQWGADLHSEHEHYLLNYCGNLPVFITEFPEQLKPFYARSGDKENIVRSYHTFHTCGVMIVISHQSLAMDLLLPGVGEVVGGSMREERLDVLKQKLQR